MTLKKKHPKPEEPLSKSQLKRRKFQQQLDEAEQEIRKIEKRYGRHRDSGE